MKNGMRLFSLHGKREGEVLTAWLPEGATRAPVMAACLECGTCLLVCDKGALDWNYPKGGFGVRFRLT
jgi:ferredoxin like protein